MGVKVNIILIAVGMLILVAVPSFFLTGAVTSEVLDSSIGSQAVTANRKPVLIFAFR